MPFLSEILLHNVNKECKKIEQNYCEQQSNNYHLDQGLEYKINKHK